MLSAPLAELYLCLQSRKRLSRQSWKWQAIFNASFISHSSGSYFYYHYLFIDFYSQISLPFTVTGSAKQPLKTKQTNAETYSPSLQLSASLWLPRGEGILTNHEDALLLQKYRRKGGLGGGERHEGTGSLRELWKTSGGTWEVRRKLRGLFSVHSLSSGSVLAEKTPSETSHLI